MRRFCLQRPSGAAEDSWATLTLHIFHLMALDQETHFTGFPKLEVLFLHAQIPRMPGEGSSRKGCAAAGHRPKRRVIGVDHMESVRMTSHLAAFAEYPALHRQMEAFWNQHLHFPIEPLTLQATTWQTGALTSNPYNPCAFLFGDAQSLKLWKMALLWAMAAVSEALARQRICCGSGHETDWRHCRSCTTRVRSMSSWT